MQICTGNPDQLWAYDDPTEEEMGIGNLQTVMSESEILKEFYPYWSEQMKIVNREDQISDVNCVDDWICLHWAYKYVQE